MPSEPLLHGLCHVSAPFNTRIVPRGQQSSEVTNHEGALASVERALLDINNLRQPMLPRTTFSWVILVPKGPRSGPPDLDLESGTRAASYSSGFLPFLCWREVGDNT